MVLCKRCLLTKSRSPAFYGLQLNWRVISSESMRPRSGCSPDMVALQHPAMHGNVMIKPLSPYATFTSTSISPVRRA